MAAKKKSTGNSKGARPSRTAEDKEIEKQKTIKYAKERAASLNETTKESYSEKNIKNKETIRRQIQTATGKLKEKVIESITYKNGVVKNRLVAVNILG
jgi:hypothetical protein